MSSQVVTAIQAAFTENCFQSPPDPNRLSETRAIHARTSHEKGSVMSARSQVC